MKATLKNEVGVREDHWLDFVSIPLFRLDRVDELERINLTTPSR